MDKKKFMNYSDHLKNQLITSYLKEILRFSDEEYQRRVWIKGIGPEWDSLGDAMDRFDGIGDIINNYKEFGITDNQNQLLIKLRSLLRDFDFDGEDYEGKYLLTPEWQEIIQLAKETLKTFKYKRTIRGGYVHIGKFAILIENILNKIEAVANIYYKNEQWAQISQETQELLLQLYPHPTEKHWEFSLKEALEVLEMAKTKLLELSSEKEG